MVLKLTTGDSPICSIVHLLNKMPNAGLEQCIS
jgi:hypothetical protein